MKLSPFLHSSIESVQTAVSTAIRYCGSHGRVFSNGLCSHLSSLSTKIMSMARGFFHSNTETSSKPLSSDRIEIQHKPLELISDESEKIDRFKLGDLLIDDLNTSLKNHMDSNAFDQLVYNRCVQLNTQTHYESAKVRAACTEAYSDVNPKNKTFLAFIKLIEKGYSDVEIVKTSELDNDLAPNTYLLVMSRKLPSEINDPSTWGEQALIIDFYTSRSMHPKDLDSQVTIEPYVGFSTSDKLSIYVTTSNQYDLGKLIRKLDAFHAEHRIEKKLELAQDIFYSNTAWIDTIPTVLDLKDQMRQFLVAHGKKVDFE